MLHYLLVIINVEYDGDNRLQSPVDGSCRVLCSPSRIPSHVTERLGR